MPDRSGPCFVQAYVCAPSDVCGSKSWTYLTLPGAGYRSLGSGPTWPTLGPDAVINEVLANLVYAGLVVSVSAGNSGGIAGLAAGATGLCEPRNSQFHNFQPSLSLCHCLHPRPRSYA